MGGPVITNFHCACSKRIPDALVARMLTERITLKCSGCKKVWSRNDLLDHGLRCPTCTTNLKRYHRVINSGMARALFELWNLSYHAPDVEWWHHKQFDRFGSREIHKLVWWGFVKQKPADPEQAGKKTSGQWQITEKGTRFACGALAVPLTAVVYLGKFECLEGDEGRIQDALGDKFDYRELMRAHAKGNLDATVGALATA